MRHVEQVLVGIERIRDIVSISNRCRKCLLGEVRREEGIVGSEFNRWDMITTDLVEDRWEMLDSIGEQGGYGQRNGQITSRRSVWILQESPLCSDTIEERDPHDGGTQCLRVDLQVRLCSSIIAPGENIAWFDIPIIGYLQVWRWCWERNECSSGLRLNRSISLVEKVEETCHDACGSVEERMWNATRNEMEVSRASSRERTKSRRSVLLRGRFVAEDGGR